MEGSKGLEFEVKQNTMIICNPLLTLLYQSAVLFLKWLL